MLQRLFVYGTLQLPERVKDIIGRPIVGTPAILEGYRCGRIDRADFPGIVPSPTNRVKGQLLHRIHQSELLLLDAYEGELYKRIRVNAICESSVCSAWVYVIAPWAHSRVSHASWSIEWYRARQLKTRWTY